MLIENRSHDYNKGEFPSDTSVNRLSILRGFFLVLRASPIDLSITGP